MNSSSQLRMLVFASLLAALMTAGAYISIPMGPVPIVLQNMFVFLAGLLLGSRWGLASVGVYLLAGPHRLPSKRPARKTNMFCKTRGTGPIGMER